MKIGLIGLPNSGKTTIFNALTRSNSPVSTYTGQTAESHVSVVEVADPRVSRLSDMYSPKKTTYATIEFIDWAAASEGSPFSGSALAPIKGADALAVVVRHFEDAAGAPPSPEADIEKIVQELSISDLILSESRLERIELAYKRGKRNHLLEMEEKLLRRIIEHLSGGHSVRDFQMDREQEKMLRGFQFLTQKPLMVVLNSEENRFGRNPELMERIERKNRAIEFAGKFEMELSRLNDPEEEKLFMEDMGIKESARNRLARIAYDLVGYISFFTVGPDEVRAWNIVRGQTAVEAAGTIHSDLARGFIRAECIRYDDLAALGSEKNVREQGKVRLEGKNYVVEDGDILNIRFNV
ncbi:MAG: redox-regulated ATPase YchF [Desulfobacteraceae bacterium]|nr:MAG: redox-regulated ATPase YchF [Desulfobacteraceae bacterium]